MKSVKNIALHFQKIPHHLIFGCYFYVCLCVCLYECIRFCTCSGMQSFCISPFLLSIRVPFCKFISVEVRVFILLIFRSSNGFQQKRERGSKLFLRKWIYLEEPYANKPNEKRILSFEFNCCAPYCQIELSIDKSGILCWSSSHLKFVAWYHFYLFVVRLYFHLNCRLLSSLDGRCSVIISIQSNNLIVDICCEFGVIETVHCTSA